MWGINYSSESLFEMMVNSGLESSNSNARQTLTSGWLYINWQKIEDSKYDFSKDFINDKFLLLQKWKKNFRLILK